MLQKISNPEFKCQISVLVSLVFTQVMPIRAGAQGMAESTSVHGAAAGLGGGIGAGSFKLFNSFSNQSNSSINASSSSSSTTSSTGSRSLQPSAKETPAQVNSRARALLLKADTDRVAGDLKGSAKSLEELARFRSKHFGNTDRGAADAYLKAGEIYQSTKDYSQAEDAFKSALGFSKRINGETSPITVPILLRLGDALAAQERNSEAALCYKQIVSLQKESADFDSKTVLAARFKLGESYYQSANYAEAERLLKQAIEENAKVPVLSKEDLAKVIDMYESSVKKNQSSDKPANKT
jgi:tetratricopeptide (TPR) repeat protein